MVFLVWRGSVGGGAGRPFAVGVAALWVLLRFRGWGGSAVEVFVADNDVW